MAYQRVQPSEREARWGLWLPGINLIEIFLMMMMMLVVVVTFSSNQASTECQGGGKGPRDGRSDWVEYGSWSPLDEEEERGETES